MGTWFKAGWETLAWLTTEAEANRTHLFLKQIYSFLQQRFREPPPHQGARFPTSAPHGGLLPKPTSPCPSRRPPTIPRRALGQPCSSCPQLPKGLRCCQGLGLPPKATREGADCASHLKGELWLGAWSAERPRLPPVCPRAPQECAGVGQGTTRGNLIPECALSTYCVLCSVLDSFCPPGACGLCWRAGNGGRGVGVVRRSQF